MQTLSEIRNLLGAAGLRPRKRLGQCFLIDKNLMGKLLELAQVSPEQTVLEVGPGSGSLTEELLDRAGKVVAVEIDRGLAELLRGRLGGREKLVLIRGDVLAGKREIAPEVLAALGSSACMVANLPYSIATPLVAQCLVHSWRRGGAEGAPSCRFDRLTFTVQREVADRMTAPPGSGRYGPVSVLAALLGRVTVGPTAPASVFWPRPKVESRMLRIDFDAAGADRLADADTLAEVLRLAFGQRRKQIGSIARRKGSRFRAEEFREALAAAEADPASRVEQISPAQFLILSNVLSRRNQPLATGGQAS